MLRDDLIREAIDLLSQTRDTFRSRQIERARKILEEALLPPPEGDIAMCQTGKTCPACGGPLHLPVSVGGMHLCRMCAGADSVQTALQIARHRHAAKLKEILAALEAEND